MRDINNLFYSLSKSKFRSSFHLKKSDFEYIEKIGLDKVREHAYDFINKRLAPSYIENDGKQTSFKGHPVFKAQHATATCCRGCLHKWHYIDENRELTGSEIDYVVNIIMKWIEKEINNAKM